ncbi:MAG: PorV/PorQ family protein [Ignavibacteriaceae bacterium]|nr:PorV/PorQ family protein [Ignavibacterium sp.]MCC6255336.1 PorV/PorQ family protein [Ignavibacteriaceae bacterium]HRN25590.1 PorV/PorQ family protein [Ignavibacteriaceae bacterium]HRQ52773.1 PorV/PorQ family protein [Ignavibacteriaceae bacterium]
MRKLSFTIVLIILIVKIGTQTSFAQENQKLAQTGMKFLSVSLDPRASGMGDATTAVFTKSAAMLYNPAIMADLEGYSDFSFGTTRWIADINYIYGTAAFNLFDGQYGVFGLSLVAVDYGEFIGTVVAPNGDGFLEVGNFKPTSFAFGIGYANKLSEKFSVGGNIKYARQSLGTAVTGFDQNGNGKIEDNKVDAVAFDFGILYHTGFKSLDFGMSIRNFATEVKYKDEDFQLPLSFKIGISINAFDFIDVDKKMHSLLVAVDASHPRDYPEQVSFGAEYLFMDSFSLRGGYTFPTDEQEFTLGVGFKQSISDVKFAIDYSYTPFGIFDNVHRISINLAY